jgi:glycosyltransferase involved in cell wall biosynthesis
MTASSGLKKVSVIIPVWNSVDSLRLCLECLEKQTCAPESFEIIVVDNASTVDMRAIQSEFPNVRWQWEGRAGSYAARNSGLTHANGEIIAFTDADCLPTPSWLQNALSALKETNATILGGRIEFLPPKEGKLSVYEIIEESTTLMLNHKRVIEKRRAAFTANLITYRSVFARIGLFNAALQSSGDFEWVQRATAQGERLVYADSVIIQHPRRSSFAALWQRTKRVAAGKIKLLQVKRAPFRQICFAIYRFSMFNPGKLFFVIRVAKGHLGARHWGTKLKFILIYSLINLGATIEQFRVLFEAKPVE